MGGAGGRGMKPHVSFSVAFCLAALFSLVACIPQASQEVSLDDLDGRARSPLVLAGAKANVVIFITNDCPIANSYAPEIQSIVRDYSPGGAAFFLVHVDPDLTVEKAKMHAADFGYGCSILRDPLHRLVSKLEADVTPEAFVLTGEGVAYRGRIDDLFEDLGKKRRKARTRDLRDALEAVLAGKTVVNPRTAAVGCYIPEL